MLDALRAHLYKRSENDAVVLRNHLKVCSNYAWFEGTAGSKDGKEIKFEEDAYDCCHAEACLKNKNGKCMIAGGAAFSMMCGTKPLQKVSGGA